MRPALSPGVSPSHKQRRSFESMTFMPSSSMNFRDAAASGQLPTLKRGLFSNETRTQPHASRNKDEPGSISSTSTNNIINNKNSTHKESDSINPVWLVPNEEGAIQQYGLNQFEYKFHSNRFLIPDDESINVSHQIQIMSKQGESFQFDKGNILNTENSIVQNCESIAFEDDDHLQKSLHSQQIHHSDVFKSPQEGSKSKSIRHTEMTQLRGMNYIYTSESVSKIGGMPNDASAVAVSAACGATLSEMKNLSIKEDLHQDSHNGIANVATPVARSSKENKKTNDYMQQQSIVNSSRIKNSQQQQQHSSSSKKASGLDAVFQRLNLLRLTWRFIDSLRRNSRMLLYKRLKPHHFRVINDKSSFTTAEDGDDSTMEDMALLDGKIRPSQATLIDVLQQRVKARSGCIDYTLEFLIKPMFGWIMNQISRSAKVVVSRMNSLPTVSPDNVILLAWNFIMSLIILVLLFFIPIQCSFQVTDWDIYIDKLSIVIFGFDGLLKLNTGFFKDGEIVKLRSKIILRSMKSVIWFHVMTVIIFILSHAWRLFFIVNVMVLQTLFERFDQYFQLKQRFYIAYEIVKLVFLVFFIASTFGSIFYLISETEVSNGSTSAWILTKPIENWLEGYVFSMYFMFITMSTVGYGDLVPQNQPEVIYVAFITLMGSCVFAYCINSIGNLLTEIANRESFFKQRTKDVMTYLRTRNISRALQVKVMRYLEYLQDIESSQSHLNTNDVLKYFSDNLKFEVNKEFFGELLKESKVFGLHFTPQFLQTLAQRMRETTLAPGDILYHKSETDNRIMFLTSGDIELFEKEVRLRTISCGEILNYRGFFGNVPHSSSARSLSISHVSFCTSDDFVDLLKTFPQDYETFCFMRDEVVIYNRSIDSKCCSCSSFSHVFQECPLIHYRLNKDTVLRRWNYSESNIRQLYQRRKHRGKSFLDLQNVKTKLKQYKVTLLTQMEEFSYLEGNDLTEDLTDKQFYKHLPSIKIAEDGQVFQDSDGSQQTDQSQFDEQDEYLQEKDKIADTFDPVASSEVQNSYILKNIPSQVASAYPPSEENYRSSNDKMLFPQLSHESLHLLTQQQQQIPPAGQQQQQQQQQQSTATPLQQQQQPQQSKWITNGQAQTSSEMQFGSPSFLNYLSAKTLGKSSLNSKGLMADPKEDGFTIDQQMPMQQNNFMQLYSQIVQQLQVQQQQFQQLQLQQQMQQQQMNHSYFSTSQMNSSLSSLPVFGQPTMSNFLQLNKKSSTKNLQQQDSSEIHTKTGGSRYKGKAPQITYGPSKHLNRQATESSRSAQMARNAFTPQISLKARSDSKDNASQRHRGTEDKSLSGNSNDVYKKDSSYNKASMRIDAIKSNNSNSNNNNVNYNNNNNSNNSKNNNNFLNLDIINNDNKNSVSESLFILLDFDVLKEFSNYFPHNNYTNVIKQNQLLYGRNRRTKQHLDRALKTNKLTQFQKTHKRPSGNGLTGYRKQTTGTKEKRV